MKNNSRYLISRDDYVKHIDDCVMLFGMLQEMCDLVDQIPQNRGSKALTDMASDFYEKAIAIMEHSGIPAVYPLFGDERFLRPLMDKELTAASPDDEDGDENDEDEFFEDEENYDDYEVPSPEELIAMYLEELKGAAVLLNEYLRIFTRDMKE